MQVRNPLDPFLNQLCREYLDDEDLTQRMHRYFQARYMNIYILYYILKIISCSTARTSPSACTATSRRVI